MPYDEEEVVSTTAMVDRCLAIAGGLEPGRSLWFRGLPCSTHGLTPKLLRGAADASAVFNREERLMTRFRQRSLPFWAAGYPQDAWEHMFVMQHNGMPTRLLDWSENLFVGLYFALSTGPQHSPVPAGHVCTPTVWCLDPVGWNRSVPHLHDFGEYVRVLTTSSDLLDSYTPATAEAARSVLRHDAPVAIYGTHNSARIVAQRGTFTVAGKGLLPMEDYAGNAIGGGTTLWKLKLGLSNANLKADLSRLGFTESMIFPDLPALARELTESEA